MVTLNYSSSTPHWRLFSGFYFKNSIWHFVNVDSFFHVSKFRNILHILSDTIMFFIYVVPDRSVGVGFLTCQIKIWHATKNYILSDT